MARTVEVESLVVTYGPRRAVDGATWWAESGTVTCILGPNGAGKTSMVQTLEGLLRPSSGRADLLGRSGWNAPAAHRARVGVMLQDGGLPTRGTARTVLTHLARMYADPRPLSELESLLGLAPVSRTMIRRLSGGERQRVALAAALVGRPEVLMLDEPTAGLDPHGRLDVWDLIRAEADRGTTVVVTTHSFEEAERLADRVVIVHRGRVVSFGPVDDVGGADGLERTYFRLTRNVA